MNHILDPFTCCFKPDWEKYVVWRISDKSFECEIRLLNYIGSSRSCHSKEDALMKLKEIVASFVYNRLLSTDSCGKPEKNK